MKQAIVIVKKNHTRVFISRLRVKKYEGMDIRINSKHKKESKKTYENIVQIKARTQLKRKENTGKSVQNFTPE